MSIWLLLWEEAGRCNSVEEIGNCGTVIHGSWPERDDCCHDCMNCGDTIVKAAKTTGPSEYNDDSLCATQYTHLVGIGERYG